MTPEQTVVALVLMFGVVPIIAVSLVEHRRVSFGEAWKVLHNCFAPMLQLSLDRDSLMTMLVDEEVDERVDRLSKYIVFLLSGVAWIFVPEIRLVIGLSWYAYCFRMLYKLRLIPDMSDGQSSRWTAVLVLGGAWLPPSAWVNSQWPLLWYGAIVLLVCWPTLQAAAWLWEMSSDSE